jgi:hypothetical protein
MKHDDFYDELYTLAHEYKLTPWWRPFKARFLRKKINHRWTQFIEELSGEREEDAR